MTRFRSALAGALLFLALASCDESQASPPPDDPDDEAVEPGNQEAPPPDY